MRITSPTWLTTSTKLSHCDICARMFRIVVTTSWCSRRADSCVAAELWPELTAFCTMFRSALMGPEPSSRIGSITPSCNSRCDFGEPT